MSQVNLALVQMSCKQDKPANLEKTRERVAKAAERGANVICLQEVFNMQYPCQSEDHRFFDLAEEIPGPTSQLMQQLAQQHQVVVSGSIFECRTHGLYHNTALTYDVDGRRGR